MTRLVDLQGEPLSWAELHRRNAEYWATHDRYGALLDPPRRAIRKALELARRLQGAADAAGRADGDEAPAPITTNAGGAAAGEATRRAEDRGFHSANYTRTEVLRA